MVEFPFFLPERKKNELQYVKVSKGLALLEQNLAALTALVWVGTKRFWHDVLAAA